ncbi:transcriptional adapter 1-like isoform X2 [Corticium candelabrum]|uniref:transcriptional adapter 1-like isoform X2 n=1 Tax=Corticium candelabrum TaxID=121492 RepID=UPI002E255761|nr:transcriptional adapter 1-like isoform X2 [Corticium candelabrum]
MDVVTARRQLAEVLGERCSTYWSTLRQWYKHKITKSEFDDQARALLGEQNGSHGGLSHRKQSAVLEDQKDTSLATKRKHRLSSTHFETVFSPVSSGFMLYSADCMESLQHQDYARAKQIQLCSQDMCLPDAISLYGRLLLLALDMELDNVADDVPHLVALAVEAFIKNVFEGVVGRRKSYSLRDGHFRHSYLWDPPLQKRQKIYNSRGTKTIDTGPSMTGSKLPTRCQRVLCRTSESEAAQILSARVHGQRRGLITLVELRDTLQVDRRLVPSNAVLCTNMERLLAKIWHSGTLEQNHDFLYRHTLQRLS